MLYQLYLLPVHFNIMVGVGLSRKGGNMRGGVPKMWWLLGRLGNQRPRGRRVITPAHEGAVSSVWQSSHNSGFIHHMGIMPLTGTTPKKSYTRSSPASESLNNPIPPLSTHCVWLESKRERLGVIDWKKKHLSWAVFHSKSRLFCI